MDAAAQKAYEQEIRRFEVALRELKVKYDQFLAGGLDREPIELRHEVESIIRRVSQAPPGKYAQRFHFNALVGRFNCFAERWGKAVRVHEEGDHRSANVAERLGLRERLLTRCVLSDPQRADQDLRRLHARFVEARARQGKGPVPFDRFARGIAAQARMLQARHECGPIEVRLVETGDEVQIRARPGR